jgi:transcriptional regulator with XRE-family HTH domain
MTPFGIKLRDLRKKNKTSLTDLAKVLKVSSAYLSLIETGKRGKPSQGMVELVCAYFGLIWDEVDTMKSLANISDTNVKINTKKLGPEATKLSNVLKVKIDTLSEEQAQNLCKTILMEVNKTI